MDLNINHGSNNNADNYNGSITTCNISAELETNLTERLLLEPVRDFERIEQFGGATVSDRNGHLSNDRDLNQREQRSPVKSHAGRVQVAVNGADLSDPSLDVWPTTVQHGQHQYE